MDISRRQLLLAGGAAALAAPGLAGLAARDHGVELDPREDAIWVSSGSRMPATQRFEGDRKVDLAIVGGGYTGLSCAYYAKRFRPDWTVVVLESHKLASSASSRNSGAVYANYVGLSEPEFAEARPGTASRIHRHAGGGLRLRSGVDPHAPHVRGRCRPRPRRSPARRGVRRGGRPARARGYGLLRGRHPSPELLPGPALEARGGSRSGRARRRCGAVRRRAGPLHRARETRPDRDAPGRARRRSRGARDERPHAAARALRVVDVPRPPVQLRHANAHAR